MENQQGKIREGIDVQALGAKDRIYPRSASETLLANMQEIGRATRVYPSKTQEGASRYGLDLEEGLFSGPQPLALLADGPVASIKSSHRLMERIGVAAGSRQFPAPTGRAAAHFKANYGSGAANEADHGTDDINTPKR